MFIWKTKWKVHNSWILLHLPFTLFVFFSSNASRSLSYLNKNMYIRKVWQSKQFRTESNGSLLILCISNLVIEDQTIKYRNTAYYFFDTTLILKQKPCQLVMVPDCISFKIYFLLLINLDGVFLEICLIKSPKRLHTIWTCAKRCYKQTNVLNKARVKILCMLSSAEKFSLQRLSNDNGGRIFLLI